MIESGLPGRTDRTAEGFLHVALRFGRTVALDEGLHRVALRIVRTRGDDDERIGRVKRLEGEAFLFGREARADDVVHRNHRHGGVVEAYIPLNSMTEYSEPE